MTRRCLTASIPGPNSPRMDSRRARSRLLGSANAGELALAAAVHRVERETDQEPHEEPNPVDDRKAGHQEHAQQDRPDRDQRTTGSTEPAHPTGLPITENQHPR